MSKKQAIQKALEHHQAGHLLQAEAIYQRILKKEPNNPDALHLAGVLAHQSGKNEEAITLIRQAISYRNAFPEAYCNLGNILKRQGELTEAMGCYHEAIALKPNLVGAHNNLGNIQRELGQLDQAMSSYRQVLAYKPDHAEAHYNLAITSKELGKLGEAADNFRQAITLKPGVAEQHFNLANVLASIGKTDEAMTQLRQAISIKPDYVDAYINLGVLLHKQGNLQLAIETYQKILSYNSNCAPAYCNLGSVFSELGKFDEAITVYRQAIESDSRLAEAYYNLGNALQIRGKLNEASQAHLQALSIKPDYRDAHNNLGNILQAQGMLDAAETHLKQAQILDPDSADSYNNLGNVYKHQSQLSEAITCYRQALKLKPEYFDAHSNLLYALSSEPNCTQSEYLIEARRYGEKALALAKPFRSWAMKNKNSTSQRILVGLVSGDLKSHPVGYFIESILGHLNREQFELVAYSTKNQEDDLTTRIKPYFNAWNMIDRLSDEEAARKIHDDGIEILIDLAGHTAFNRLPLFAWKSAPVQVSWLGYFASTGLPGMDYLLADPVSVPDSCRCAFTEEIVYLPESRLCFTPPVDGNSIAVSGLPAEKNGHITFGCFQTLSKLGDNVLSVWSRIMNRLPQTRLRLQNKQMSCQKTREQLRNRLAQFGIAQERVSLLGHVSRSGYLAAHAEVDFVLDTFPYPGGTTTCEALWMGVPTLTLAGETMLSRQGASLLTAAGLPEWVATTADEYVAKAVAFSQELTDLSALRQRLRGQVKSSPLFDANRFARDLEAALRIMWDSKCPETNRNNGDEMKNIFLHVGCGSNRKDRTTREFNTDSWQELRLDINESTHPDIVGTMIDMSAVANETVDAIFSSHNIEHLYPHEVPLALKEFIRVLKPEGFLVVTCPDLQSVCALVAEDKLTDPAYTSPAGPIAPIDILYGHRASMERGNLYMAHRCGFTKKVLIGTLRTFGFASLIAANRGAPFFDIWAIASKLPLNQEELRTLAVKHFPA